MHSLVLSLGYYLTYNLKLAFKLGQSLRGGAILVFGSIIDPLRDGRCLVRADSQRLGIWDIRNRLGDPVASL